MQTEHYYGYSSSVRVKQFVMAGITAILTITFVGLLVVMTFVTLLQILRSGTAALNAPGSYVFAIVCSSPILLMLLGFLTASLTMYPAITVREDGFRIHSLIGKSSWLAWDAIKKARRVDLPRRSWMIGIKGLGWLYWPTGFFFWLWMPGIHLTQAIDDYHGLMRVFREKRPDLFGPYR